MKNRLNNIIFLAVTFFLFSCSVNEKLDQNLAEMHEMNKNMEAMNKNIATGMGQFGDMSDSIRSLSDETVAFLKKTDPQQFFDMFNTISDRFEEMLGGLMDNAGDIKGFIEKANEVTDLFLSYSKALTPEDLTHVKDALDKITGVTEQINSLMAKTDNYEAMANQVFLTTQMFATVGLALGQSLDLMDKKDVDGMMTLMDANMKNMDLASSSGQIMQQMQELQKNSLSKNKNNDLTKLIDGFITKVLPAMDQLKKMWTSEKSLDQKWDEMDKRYTDTFCFALAYVDGITQSSPIIAINKGWSKDDDYDKTKKMKEDLHNLFLKKCPDYKNVVVKL